MRAGRASAVAAGVLALSGAIFFVGQQVAVKPPSESGSGLPGGARENPGGNNRSAPQTGESIVAARTGDLEALQRIAPREPLSVSTPPRPPRTAGREAWRTRTLYRPVAAAAGHLTAMGYSLAIEGIDGIGLAETCSFEGRDWPCGTLARTAFRAWLRGRAVACVTPEKPATEALTTGCTLAGEDVGAWLVNQGWARAAANGPYLAEEEDAREARRGIFGPPPRLK